MKEAQPDERIRAAAVQGPARAGPWTFAVRPGEVLWIPEGPDSPRTWLDWLTGIEAPPAGEVFWKGVEWRRRGPDEAAAERGRIGCVFAQGGLLANLDMDENVWLPARMHRREGAAEEIERWARFFECWPLPPERAPAVPERTRRRLQWTRALAGRPEALVLERPLAGAAPEDCGLLRRAVQETRAAGCAVIWIDGRMEPETRAALEPLAEAAPQTA